MTRFQAATIDRVLDLLQDSFRHQFEELEEIEILNAILILQRVRNLESEFIKLPISV